jgi:D-3-phosphoglycerate dehydrogenase
MRTLLVGEIHPEAKRMLEENTELRLISNDEFVEEVDLPSVEAVVLRTFTRLSEKDLDKLPDLKYVVSCSVGLNNLDLDALKKKGIKLIHCPGSNANSVAEHTLYLILSLIRKNKPFPELKSKTVGIIGLGYIGKVVARKLLGFEAKVIAFDVIPQNPEVLKELRVEMKSFDEVVREADVLTVHVPLNKHTENLINGKVFEEMKEGVFFVNTSRAEVIDEEALLKNIMKFNGLGLDVYSDDLKEKLANEKNVILTDHVGAQGEDSFKEMCLRPVNTFLEDVKIS